MHEVIEAAKRLAECCSYMGSTSYCLERCPYKERVTDEYASWNVCSKKFEDDFITIVNYVLSVEDDGK